jgi:hypothetical protein
VIGAMLVVPRVASMALAILADAISIAILTYAIVSNDAPTAGKY